MTRLRLRAYFLTLPCLSLLASACGGVARTGTENDTTSQSLSSPLSFPVGVETSCYVALMQLSPNLEAGLDLAPDASPMTVTLTSSGRLITATINGTTPSLAPVQFTAISGASATVVSGQTLTVPTSTISASSPVPPQVNEALPVEGGSIDFSGDSFFLSLEMTLQGSAGPGTVAAAFECTAAGKVPADCVCPAGNVCACSSTNAPPLGVYTQCSTYLGDVGGPGGTEGGDTTVTLAEQNGQLTMALGGGPNPPDVAGNLDLTPTSAATATISSGQSIGGRVVGPGNSCTPGGDLWSPPETPLSIESGSLTTDGQWLTVSIVGTSPCSTEERLAVICPVRSP